MQFVPGPAGFERCVSADVQGARREGGDLNGFAQYGKPESYAVWGDNGEEGVAGEEGCDQYLADEGVFGGTAGEAWNEEESGKEVEEQWGEEGKRSSPQREQRSAEGAEERGSPLRLQHNSRSHQSRSEKSDPLGKKVTPRGRPEGRPLQNRGAYVSGNKGSRREHLGGELRYMDSRGRRRRNVRRVAMK